MTFNLSRMVTAGIQAMVLACTAQMGQSAGVAAPPTVPAALKVPDGNSSYLKGRAVGTQNYMCMPTANGFGWTFTGPQATLFIDIKWITGDIEQQVTTHFLSPNPMERGTARATWQGSFDTSSAWARSIASHTEQTVAPAIPWLLLEVVGLKRGPTGGDLLSDTTYIHRLNTTGGVTPTSECSASNVGATTFVPYTADYYFYRADRRN